MEEQGEAPLGWDELHAAATRLEELLATLPYDRALPDLHTILDMADVPAGALRQDERVRKVLHEAILARPLASHEAVVQRRTEVELLTLEVSVLRATLTRTADTTDDDELEERARATQRLAWIRSRLTELRQGL